MPSTSQLPDPFPSCQAASEKEIAQSASRHDSPRVRRVLCKGHFWLLLFALLAVLAMIFGIIFVAHRYYHDFGGQGFLKGRGDPQADLVSKPEVYLPLRLIARTWEMERRSPQKNVPFYACGDQLASCEEFDQSNLCCPVRMSCHSTPLTASGVYCCNSTRSDAGCDASPTTPPKCLPSTTPCDEAVGGGCCAAGLVCSPNGCLEIQGPSTIMPTYQSESALSAGAEAKTVTVVQSPASTTTLVKEAEVAQSAEVSEFSMLVTFAPYTVAWGLVCITALMGLL